MTKNKISSSNENIKIFDMMDKKQQEKCLQEINSLQSVEHSNIV